MGYGSQHSGKYEIKDNSLICNSNLLTSESGGYFENKTDAVLRVGWEPEVSPFDKSFDKTFLKRCRAYDNNGLDFDIEMVFRILEKNRYISDGNQDTIVTSYSNKDNINNSDLEVILYE